MEPVIKCNRETAKRLAKESIGITLTEKRIPIGRIVETRITDTVDGKGAKVEGLLTTSNPKEFSPIILFLVEYI